jgi:hypothetical protein
LLYVSQVVFKDCFLFLFYFFFSAHSGSYLLGWHLDPACLAHTLNLQATGLQRRPVSQISSKDNRLLKKKEEAQGGL